MTGSVTRIFRDIPDPVQGVNQVLLLFFMLSLIFVIYRYRDRVFLVLTGDDRIHANVHDACWTACFKCCNTCTGEWTRCVTAYLCFWHKRLRGRNLVRIIGQQIGMVPIPVQVSNLVVGDLPTGRIGHYYLQIEAGESPPQTSSVAEDVHSRMVPFNRSRFVIRVRNSPVEDPVHFTVMELHTFGHKRLCECFIHPMSLLEWAEQRRGPMRFKMDPCHRGAQNVVPSWLLLEATPQREFGSPNMSHFNVNFTEARSGKVAEFDKATTFKVAYQLVDTAGAQCAEPDQKLLERVDRLKRRKSVWLGVNCGVCCTVFGVVFIGFWLAHIYTFSCYRGFMKLKVLKEHQALPSWKHADRAKQVLVSCNWNENPFEVLLFEDLNYLLRTARQHTRRSAFASKLLSNTSVLAHHNLSVDNFRCHPNVTDEECGVAFPGWEVQSRRPMFLEEYMPIDVRCFAWSCPMHSLIEQIRHYVLFIIIVWAAVLLCLRNFMDDMIGKRQRHLEGPLFRHRPQQLLDGFHTADHGEPMSARAFSH